MSGYDDRDGFIWMDGKLVEWRSANVHILTHALHYASSVFEGERCYNGKIFKGHEHSLRLLESGRLLDMPIPYTAEEIDAAKEAVLKANGLTDAYIRAVAFRGAGDEMGVASLGNPVRLAVACWSWGAYYGDAKMKGAKLDIAKYKGEVLEQIMHWKRQEVPRQMQELPLAQVKAFATVAPPALDFAGPLAQGPQP